MERSPTIPLSAIIALSVIVGGIFWIKGPLTSKRPAPADRGERDVIGAQDVEARLWQDPFLAIEEHGKHGAGNGHHDQTQEAGHASSQERHTLSHLAESIESKKSVRVIPVMIPGGNYAEEVERRRRTRKALVAALGASNYVPNDATRIGYIETNWLTTLDGCITPSDGDTNDATVELMIPFEWFTSEIFADGKQVRDIDSRKNILVLWLDETMIETRTVPIVDSIIDSLKLKPERHDVSIIGPSSSTTVLDMMRRSEEFESDDSRSCRPYKFKYPVTFLSCRSTASQQLLLEELRISAPPDSFPAYFEDRVGATFVRTVAPDDDVLAAMFRELDCRGVDLTDTSVHAALIGEWDTFYGRSIPRAFHYEIDKRITSHSHEDGAHHATIHQFSYLRGLDGILPDATGTTVVKTESNASRGATTGAAFAPRPEDISWPFGRNQLDNVQRLAAQLQRTEDLIKRNETQYHRRGKGIDVIGVVGSDIYDKLLILQALAPRFPNAIFFTTDLDAQMLHPTQQAWARNVIVVSSYGLSLGDTLQGSTLPFRDTYQTATYAAALQAVGGLPHDLHIEPRVFEIGRHGVVDLSPPPCSHRSGSEPQLHPPHAALSAFSPHRLPESAPCWSSLSA